MTKKEWIAFSNNQRTLIIVFRKNRKVMLRLKNEFFGKTDSKKALNPLNFIGHLVYFEIASSLSNRTYFILDFVKRKVLETYRKGSITKKKDVFLIEGKRFVFDFEAVRHNKMYRVTTYQASFEDREAEFQFEIPPGVFRPILSPFMKYALFITHHSFSLVQFEAGRPLRLICEYRTEYFFKFEQIEFLEENVLVMLMSKKEKRYIEGEECYEDLWVNYLITVKVNEDYEQNSQTFLKN